MATEPKRPGDDNVVSLREARARQAAAQAAAERNRQTGSSEKKKVPVLLVFLGLLAVFVAWKFLLG